MELVGLVSCSAVLSQFWRRFWTGNCPVLVGQLWRTGILNKLICFAKLLVI